MKDDVKKEFSTLPEINHCGDILFMDYCLKRHRSVNNELTYLLKGSLNVEYENGITEKAVAGDLLLLPYNVTHRDVFSADKRLEAFIIHFRWDSEDEYCQAINNENLKHLSPEVDFEVKTLLNEIRSNVSCWNKCLINESRLHLLLMLIYQDIVNNAPNSQNPYGRKKEYWVRQVRSFVEANISRDITLEEISEHLRVSKFYICREFKMHTGFTIFQYITKLRMKLAVDMLSEGRLFISEIAHNIGFPDSKYFSKVFKKYYNCSPHEYKLRGDADAIK